MSTGQFRRQCGGPARPEGGTASGAIGPRPQGLRLSTRGAERRGRPARRGRSGRSSTSRLSGGDTPGPRVRAGRRLEADWSPARLWWGDERCVPPDDERSNYLLVKRTLLDRLERQPSEVHRIRGELGGEAAAAEYDRELEGVDARARAAGARAGRPHRFALPELARSRRARAACRRRRRTRRSSA